MARRLLLQALYAWQVSKNTPHEVILHFQEDLPGELGSADFDYFSELFHEIAAQHEMLDLRFAPHLNRKPHELDEIERSILRIGTYELLYRLEIPYKVIINEAVELAKRFGAEQGHRFVNAVLDTLAKEVRTTELQSEK